MADTELTPSEQTDKAEWTPSKPLTEDELCRYAAANKSLACADRNPRSWDWLAWYQLRDMYADFRAGKMTKEQGEQTKRSIFRQRDKAITDYDYNLLKNQRFADFWRQIEEAGAAYMKAPSIEAADRFVEAVYRVGRKIPTVSNDYESKGEKNSG